MTTDREEQEERRQTLLNDKRVREQGSTFLSHTHSDAGGRFASVGEQTVVGQSPNPYPQMPDNNPWRSDPVPPEPPLGIDINEMPPTGEVFEVEQSIAELTPTSEPSIPGAQGDSGDPTAAPSSPSSGLMSKRVGSPPFLKDKR